MKQLALSILVVGGILLFFELRGTPTPSPSQSVTCQGCGQRVAQAAWVAWNSMDCDSDYEAAPYCNEELQNVNLPPRVVYSKPLPGGGVEVQMVVTQKNGVKEEYTITFSKNGTATKMIRK